MTLPFRQYFTGQAYGVREDALFASLAPVAERLRQDRDSGALPFLALPEKRDDIAPIRQWAEDRQQRYDRLVVFGTGGSSLGGRTLCALVANPFAHGPVLFIDNISPHGLQCLLDTDLSRTCFLAISKSGGTMETLCQLYLLHEVLLKRVGTAKTRAAITVVTGPETGPLRRFAEAHGLDIHLHDPKLGGRFSVLSNVGLMPAAFAGIDLVALRGGAASSLDDMFANEGGIAGMGAAWAVAQMQASAAISVLMIYSDRLQSLGNWYRQLWAESLGKGGKGSTPVQALGTVDQHSQLQLYLDGPRDKAFTLIANAEADTGPRLRVPEGEVPYLAGAHVGNVMHAHARATSETLAKYGLPVRVLELERIDAATLGSLFMHFMLETVLAAALIGVDPYDQPAVEESKNLARQYLQNHV